MFEDSERVGLSLHGLADKEFDKACNNLGK